MSHIADGGSVTANVPVKELLFGGIDPESDLHKILLDPTPEWTQKWIESFLSIDSEQGAIVSFKLYPQQVQMLYGGTGRDVTIKGRQTRASSLLLARNLRRMTTGSGLKCVVMTQDDQTTATFRERLKHHLRDLATHGLEYIIALDNDNELVIGDLENRYMFTSGEQRVAGRAITGHIVHLSEVAHYPMDKAYTLLGGITPSVPGPPYGQFDMESTPKGAEGVFYEHAIGAKPMNPEDDWTVHLYPWWLEPRYVVGTGTAVDKKVTETELARRIAEFEPSPDEAKLIEEFGLSVPQILWRRVTWRAMAKTDTPFLQEFVERIDTCFVSASENFFASPDGVDHLAYYRVGLREPVMKKETLPWAGGDISFFGSNLSIWEFPQPGEVYVGWMDCAGGGLDERSDFTALTVLNVQTMHHVATLRLKVAPTEAAAMAAAVMKYYNSGALGGERDAYGATCVSTLERIGYRNLWYYTDPTRNVEPQVWGHPTQVRDKILESLRKQVFEHSLVTSDRILLQEMGSFGWAKARGTRKAVGKQSHDDLVLSMAGATYIAPFYRARAKAPDEPILIDKHGLVIRKGSRKGPQPWMR